MIASAQKLDELDAAALREKKLALAEHQQRMWHQKQILVTKVQEVLYKDTKIAAHA